MEAENRVDNDRNQPAPDIAPPAPAGAVRRALRTHGEAMIAVAAATLIVELGVYVVAVAAGAGPLQACLATLAASALWTAIAAPSAAAGADDPLGAFLRAGTVADASAAALAVLALASPVFSAASAVKAWCVLAAVALAAAAALCLARSRAAKAALAVAVGLLLLLRLASPFLAGGAARSPDRPFARSALAAAIYVNPFYAATNTLDVQPNFVWHRDGGLMYSHVEGGFYGAAPPACWYAPVLIDLSTALALGVAAAMFRHRSRGKKDYGD